MKPELIKKFPEFQSMQDLEDMKASKILKGHPRKLSFAFNLAIDSLDDGIAFIEKIESIGHKHVNKMADADMEVRNMKTRTTVYCRCVESTDVGTGGAQGARAPPLFKDLGRVPLFVQHGCSP